MAIPKNPVRIPTNVKGSAPKPVTNEQERQAMEAKLSRHDDDTRRAATQGTTAPKKPKKQAMDSLIPATRCHAQTLEMIYLLAEEEDRDPAYIIRTVLTKALEQRIKAAGLEEKLSL